MFPGLEQHSCNGCGVLKVLWHAQLSFGKHWDHREHSVTILLLHICIDHFIKKENKGILQVLDTYHHWNVVNLLFESREKILHGSQQAQWWRQCFGHNSCINHLLAQEQIKDDQTQSFCNVQSEFKKFSQNSKSHWSNRLKTTQSLSHCCKNTNPIGVSKPRVYKNFMVLVRFRKWKQ